MTQIYHDAFARYELHREIVKGENLKCTWCGRSMKRLFKYYVQNDGIYTFPRPIKGLFCSIDCMRVYNGG